MREKIVFLHHKIQGNGKPMLFIHGLFGDLNNLNGLTKSFSEDHKIIQIDLPNHGLSDRVDKFDYNSLAEHIAIFLKSIHINRICLIGHSMGGKVAMALALLYPDLVDRLVILDISPVCYQENRHENVFLGLTATEKEMINDRKTAEKCLSEYINDPSVRQFLLKSFRADQNGQYHWRFDIQRLLDNYTNIMDWPLTGQFFGNTLFIKGEHSDYIQAKDKSVITSFFPNAKAHIIAQTGHWLHAEKPEMVTRTIARFLSQDQR